jgi:hypothetical protein
MEAKAVSALRSKRGLRPVEQVAEPQLVGRTPQTTNERRANTMKTYILREPKAVEPQKPVRTRRSAPAPASATTLLGPPRRTRQRARPLHRFGRAYRLHRRLAGADGHPRSARLRDNWRPTRGRAQVAQEVASLRLPSAGFYAASEGGRLKKLSRA